MDVMDIKHRNNVFRILRFMYFYKIHYLHEINIHDGRIEWIMREGWKYLILSSDTEGFQRVEHDFQQG